MKRRLIKPRPMQPEVISKVDETTQQEPNLREILIAYQQGKDISDYVHIPASKATAHQQFANRIGKVDPLTELPEYIAGETRKAQQAVEQEKKRKAKSNPIQQSEPSTQVEQPSQS